MQNTYMHFTYKIQAPSTEYASYKNSIEKYVTRVGKPEIFNLLNLTKISWTYQDTR